MGQFPKEIDSSPSIKRLLEESKDKKVLDLRKGRSPERPKSAGWRFWRIFRSNKEVRIASGLKMLTEKYATQLKELETRMTEVKRKLEIVKEASRLLEEEGLSEDNPPLFFGER